MAKRTPGWLMLAIKDGITSFVNGPDGLPLEQITGSGVVHTYYHDQLGSTRVIADTSGTVENTYAFDAYGNLTGSTGSVANAFRFAGQYLDSESSMYYMRARFYDPIAEQFTSRDLAAASTREPYVYANSSPLSFRDPLGLWGAGVTLGAAWEYAAGLIGMTRFVSDSSGVFRDNRGKVSAGYWGTAGGFDKRVDREHPDWVLPARAQGDTPGRGTTNVVGDFAAVGPSVFLTNASCAHDESGPFTQTNWNIGFGPLSLSFQFRKGSNGAWNASGAVKLGWSIGYSTSQYDTDTRV